MSSSKKRKATSEPDVEPIVNQESVQQAELNETEIKLVQWEEWALTTEEHFHAEDLHARMPNGPAMGHVHR